MTPLADGSIARNRSRTGAEPQVGSMPLPFNHHREPSATTRTMNVVSVGETIKN